MCEKYLERVRRYGPFHSVLSRVWDVVLLMTDSVGVSALMVIRDVVTSMNLIYCSSFTTVQLSVLYSGSKKVQICKAQLYELVLVVSLRRTSIQVFTYSTIGHS